MQIIALNKTIKLAIMNIYKNMITYSENIGELELSISNIFTTPFFKHITTYFPHWEVVTLRIILSKHTLKEMAENSSTSSNIFKE